MNQCLHSAASLQHVAHVYCYDLVSKTSKVTLCIRYITAVCFCVLMASLKEINVLVDFFICSSILQ